MSDKILQKLNRGNEKPKMMTIKIVVEEEVITTHSISLSLHELDALRQILIDGDSKFFYCLKDTGSNIKDILTNKSKDIAWKNLNP